MPKKLMTKGEYFTKLSERMDVAEMARVLGVSDTLIYLNLRNPERIPYLLELACEFVHNENFGKKSDMTVCVCTIPPEIAGVVETQIKNYGGKCHVIP